MKQLDTGKSYRVTGNQFDIAKSTLRDHATGKVSRVGAGRPTVLSSEEEKAIVRSCQELAHNGLPLEVFLAFSTATLLKMGVSEIRHPPPKLWYPKKERKNL